MANKKAEEGYFPPPAQAVKTGKILCCHCETGGHTGCDDPPNWTVLEQKLFT